MSEEKTNNNEQQQLTDALNVEKVEEVTLDDLDFGGSVEDIPSFEESDLVPEEKVTESPEDIENKKKFIKSLAPEYKAELVFAMSQKQEGARLIVGHEKRILLRKMTRDAKKGKLDKYFL